MQLLTLPQVAQRLGLSPRSLKHTHYRQKLGIPVIKIGTSVRIAEQDLEAFITARRVVPTEQVMP